MFTPRFADRVDYRPTNLPAGYEGVGYRAAPAARRGAVGKPATTVIVDAR
jgi:hypothetical protein